MTGTSYNGTIPVAAAVDRRRGTRSDHSDRAEHVRTTTTTGPTASSVIRAAGSARTSTFCTTTSTAAIRRAATTATRRYRDGEFAEDRDRAHGDYNDFWAARDLLPRSSNIKAAVLMSHAFNDWNVVPEHSVRIYEALKGRVPLQAYYHQGGHGGAPPLEMMNKWFTRYLYGVQNGVENDPKAWIVREAPRRAAGATTGATARQRRRADAGGGRGRGATPPPTPYADYPNPDAAPVTLHLAARRAHAWARSRWRRRRSRAPRSSWTTSSSSGAGAGASASSRRIG